MATRSQSIFPTIRTEGGLLPADLLKRIADGDKGLDGLTPESYHLDPGQRLNEATNQAWSACRDAWQRFAKQRTELADSETGTTLTRERWLLILFRELGYGRLQASPAVTVDDKSYPVSHGWGSAPIHLVSFRYDLDKSIPGVARVSPHSLVQELLNRSDERLWGFVSNGLVLRILRDNVSFTRPAYVEFDLEAMFAGEVYSDFVLLWLLCHQSRIEGERPEQCWLEKWHQAAKQQGTRALDRLRDGVQRSIEALGQGFLAHRSNTVLRERLAAGTLTTQQYYQQLLRLVYRLIFLFVAEDRELLARPDTDPAARRRYEQHYALARVRQLAGRRRGTRHGDHWQGVRLVLRLLYRGEPRLALPALGSFLFSERATPDLDACELANDDLLAAVRHLAFTVDRNVLRGVDFKNLGSEELGSVYESLLELHPQINATAATFALASAAGSERKTSGSYYTPSSLINCLLDSALDPVVEERLKGKSGTVAEQALLALKICDPACGSGHFLVSAANRLAHRLARIRTGDDEPSPAARRTAYRDVVGHCIYGVDINPMAVELCKVAVWMEALEPGKPLSFLDHRIQCGNSLLGVTPALLAKGIPDEAFEPIEGDDKAVSRELKRRNRDERKGQGQLWDTAGRPWERLGNLATAIVALDTVADDTLAGVQDKQHRWQELVQSYGYLSGRLLADAWCAAFVWKKTREMGDAITESVFRRIERNPHDLTPWMREEIKRLAEQYQFFNWHLAFPDVFRVPGPDDEPENEQTGWNGGFHVVLGNPPWEKFTLQEREFFAAQLDISAAKTKAGRARSIEILAQTEPALYKRWLDARRHASGVDAICRHSGHFPLTAIGELNTYQLFTELTLYVVGALGKVGIITKTGILNAEDASSFTRYMFQSRRLFSAIDVVNIRGWFPGVVANERFCLLTLGGANSTCDSARIAFYCLDPTDAKEPDKSLSLTQDDLNAINPNTGTLPTLSSNRDLCLLRWMQTRHHVLVRESSGENPWSIRFGTILHSSGDSSKFEANTAEALLARGVRESAGLEWHDGVQYFLPYYEGKMIHSYSHRHGTFESVRAASRFGTKAEPEHPRPYDLADPEWRPWPRYWVSQHEANAAFAQKGCAHAWLFGLRKVCRGLVDARTVQGCLLPRVPCSDSISVLHFSTDRGAKDTAARRAAELLAVFLSVPLDWIVRQKLFSANLQRHILYQLPVPTPSQVLRFLQTCGHSHGWVINSALELSYAAWDLLGHANDCGYCGPPFRWNDERRFLIRCELDAAFFHLYLGTPDDWRQGGEREMLRYFPVPRGAVDYILETFPIVKRRDEATFGSYRTKDTILSIYDEMAEVIAANAAVSGEQRVASGTTGHSPIATGPNRVYKTRLDPPPGPPADAAGNFLPLPEWKPGQPRPANWPRHIHASREVHEWAIANGIDWRELLDGPPGVLPQPKHKPRPIEAIPSRPPAIAAQAVEPGVLPGLESAVAAIASESKRREREKELVLQAFRDVRDGRSPDYVIAAPDVNPQFLARARELGVESPDVEVNLML